MSIFKSNKGENVPQTVPRFHVIKIESVNYTQPKLHIPRIEKNGKKVADLSKPWYVWFKFRNPETGKFDNKSKFNCKHGINRYKTYKQRKEFGDSLVRNYTKLLAEGYNPFLKTIESSELIDFSHKEVTVLNALETALKEKQHVWAQSTSKVATFRIEKFIEFLKQQQVAGLDSRHLTRIHVTSFLKKLQAKGESQTSVNNYRAALSGIFSQMVENNHIDHNYVKVKQILILIIIQQQELFYYY